MTVEVIEDLLQALQARQKELELQNEALRQKQKELERSRKKYLELYELAPVGYLLIDKWGVIKEANQTGAALLGMAKEALVDQPFSSLVADEDQEAYQLYWLSLLDKPEGGACELKLLRSGCEGFYAHLESRAVADRPRNIDHIQVVINDVSEQKQLEQERLQAQKMEAVQELAGGVAHHFNNILTAILGYVDLSLDDLGTNHPVSDNLRVVKQAAHRAADLTYQLLAFTRQHLVQTRKVNLNDLIFKLRSPLNNLVGEKISLTVSSDPDLQEVKIDPIHFEKLLTNLVINAREAMPEGGQLKLEASNVSIPSTEEDTISLPSGDYVRLTLADTGVGMDEAVKARIFEPFFTTKVVGQGIGLGLSMCLGIVQQHRGYLIVESQPGQGTTFKIYFPCLPLERPPQRVDVPAAHLSESETLPEALAIS